MTPQPVLPLSPVLDGPLIRLHASRDSSPQEHEALFHPDKPIRRLIEDRHQLPAGLAGHPKDGCHPFGRINLDPPVVFACDMS
jgi:hypothetical protein